MVRRVGRALAWLLTFCSILSLGGALAYAAFLASRALLAG